MLTSEDPDALIPEFLGTRLAPALRDFSMVARLRQPHFTNNAMLALSKAPLVTLCLVGNIPGENFGEQLRAKPTLEHLDLG